MTDKSLYLVLTRTISPLSQLVRLIKGDAYTHAALAFDPELRYMFSFGARHYYNPLITCFKRESLDEDLYGISPRVPGMIVELPVTEQQYQKALRHMESFIMNSHLYSYNFLGLPAYLLHIELQRQYRFFCSEFVYYILHQSGVCDLHQPRCFISPQDLLNIGGNIIYEGNLKRYAQQQQGAPVRFIPILSAMAAQLVR